MKKTTLVLSFVALMLCGTCPAWAQKKPLDHSVYDGWQSVRSVQLTPDGRLVSYEVNPQEGDGTLYIKNLQTGAEAVIARGTGLKWAQDARVGLFTLKAPFADVRQAKIDKKKKDEQPKDSVARIDLATLAWETVGAAGKTALGYEAAPYLFVAQDVKDRKAKNLLVIEPGEEIELN